MKKWLKVLFLSCTLVLGSACFVGAYASTSRGAQVVYAEGEQTEQPQVVEETAPAKEEGWAKNMLETYIVPLFASVSITAIVSFAVSVLLTVVKNHLLDKKIIALQEKQNDANKLYNMAVKALTDANEALEIVEEIKAEVVNANGTNEEVKAYIVEKMQRVEALMVESNKETMKIEKIQMVLGLLANLQIKVANQSQEVIKSGILDDVNQISQLLKEI